MSVDVCIVGAGVAGALVACELTARGKSVAILDTGPRFEYPDMERYGMVRRFEYPWKWETSGRDSYEANINPTMNLNAHRIKAVGGTTLHWGGATPRLQPGDFKLQSRFGVGVDWPFEYDDLEPSYLRAEHELGVSGLAAPDGPPRQSPYPLPAHPFSYADKEMFLPAFKRMGLSVGSVPMAINSRPYGGRPQCSAFATCGPMCPIGAKYNALVHIRQAEASGKALVKPNCHVRRIVPESPRTVKYVEFVNEKRMTERQTAKAFVLAAGAVEVPRLLLLSANEHHSAGLANSSGLVGRNFMIHPLAHVFGKLPERLGPHRIGFATAQSWALYNHRSMPDLGNVLIYVSANDPTPAEIAVRSGTWGKRLQEHIRDKFGFGVALGVFGEMLPKVENRVRLGQNKDQYGDPVPLIQSTLTEFERKSLGHGVRISRDLLQQMGATDIHTREPSATAGHLLGTTRMGTDSAASVCDQWGRCHDLDNLFVAGSSLFPTGGCSNPTLTIAALALRTGECLADSF